MKYLFIIISIEIQDTILSKICITDTSIEDITQPCI
jgi:hypothetical protein